MGRGVAVNFPQALPTLSGRWFDLYRGVWWSLLICALAAASAGTWFQYQRGGWLDRAFYGAGIRATSVDRRLTFAPVGDATRGWFPAGSTLLAVDGHPVADQDTERNKVDVARKLGQDDGRVVRLSFSTPKGGRIEVPVRRGAHHLAQSDRDAPMTYRSRVALSQSSRLVVIALLIITAAMLFRRRPRDPVVALLSTGILLVVTLAAGGLAMAELGAADSLLRLIASLSLCAILLAIVVFPTGRFSPRWTSAIIPLLLVIMTVPFWPDVARGLAIGFSVLAMLFAVAAATWRFVEVPAGSERQQIKWAMLGMVALVLLTITAAVLGVIDRQVADNHLHFALLLGKTLSETLAFALLCAGLLVSLLRYRLYDADAAISRSATLAALTLLLIAVFATTEKLIETLGEQWFGGSAGSAGGAIAAGFAAVLLVPMHRRLDTWAEHRFQRNLVSLRKLPELVLDLRETRSLEQLAIAVLDRIASSLRSIGGAIVLPDGEVVARHGESGDHPVTLPLVDNSCGHVGDLHLGPRPDGTLYGKDEMQALMSVAGPVARAIAIVRERGETEVRWQRHLEELRESFESRLRVIEERLPPAGRTAS